MAPAPAKRPRRSAAAEPRRTSSTRAKRRPGKTRAPWGTISRARVIDAALAAVERGEFEQMTIRSLADELGVAPMSLYRHVRDKDDLLDEVVDRLLAGAWRPRASPNDWRKWVGEAANKLRAFLVEQPAALHVFLRHPVASPSAVERMEAMLDVLRRSGFGAADANRAYAAVHTYAVGFAALEASRARWEPSEEESSGLAGRLASYTTSAQFNRGLRYLLDGLAADTGLRSDGA